MLLEQLKELIVSIILGAIQGLTEFLPISSTAHLGIASQLMGKDLGIYATNLISLGTTVAVIEYFWKDIVAFAKNWRNIVQWFQLAIATLPITIVSLIFADKIDKTLRTLTFFGVFLIMGALLLAAAEWYHKHKQTESQTLSTWDYLIIGLFQALAVFPGMSRSGSTLAGGLFIAKDRTTVVRASFWLSVPAFILAGAYSLYKLLKTPYPPQFINSVSDLGNLSWVSIIAGAISAYVVGIFSLRWLIAFLSKQSSSIFIFYRIALGVILILTSLLWR
jgi:undecaprenyl-diphosphatase